MPPRAPPSAVGTDSTSLVELVGEHVVLADGVVDGNCREKEIVYYADKRVKHDLIVDLDERLQYILAQYGKNDPLLCDAIRRNFAHCRQVEAKIFNVLDYQPEDLTLLVDPVVAEFHPAFQWQGVCV